MIAQAGGKYDPSMTVVKAKGLRNKTEEIPEDPSSRTKSKTQQEAFPDLIDDEQEEQIPETAQEEKIENSSPEEKKFKLQDNAGKLHQLIQIVHKHPGDEKIHIGDKIFSLSDEGKQQVYDLL